MQVLETVWISPLPEQVMSSHWKPKPSSVAPSQSLSRVSQLSVWGVTSPVQASHAPTAQTCEPALHSPTPRVPAVPL